MSTETQKAYPLPSDADGFFIENDSDEAMNIQTKVYENGNKIKRVVFSDGKIGVMHELLAEDTKLVSRFMNQDPEEYQMASITVATKVDGEKKPIEYFKKLKMKDFNKLLAMLQDLNF